MLILNDINDYLGKITIVDVAPSVDKEQMTLMNLPIPQKRNGGFIVRAVAAYH